MLAVWIKIPIRHAVRDTTAMAQCVQRRVTTLGVRTRLANWRSAVHAPKACNERQWCSSERKHARGKGAATVLRLSRHGAC